MYQINGVPLGKDKFTPDWWTPQAIGGDPNLIWEGLSDFLCKIELCDWINVGLIEGLKCEKNATRKMRRTEMEHDNMLGCRALCRGLADMRRIQHLHRCRFTGFS